MEQEKRHGGRRSGAGRPANDRNIVVSVRLSQEAVDKLNRMTNNKSWFIDKIIKQLPEWRKQPARLLLLFVLIKSFDDGTLTFR